MDGHCIGLGHNLPIVSYFPFFGFLSIPSFSDPTTATSIIILIIAVVVITSTHPSPNQPRYISRQTAKEAFDITAARLGRLGREVAG